ncbi:MAG: hypothetical protein WCK08_15090 [Betaproteobacteria bacterium]
MWEQDTLDWLKAPPQAVKAAQWMRGQGITVVYLYAGAHVDQDPLVESPQAYAELLKTLHRVGLEVHALLGSGYLRTEKYVLPENRERARLMVQRVLDYNQRASVGEWFTGIHLDIEPHVLDDWSSRREEYIRMWLQVSEMWMAMKRQSGQRLIVSPAIVFWLDGIRVEHAGVTKAASEHMQDIYDHVVLMDYRNRALGPDGILSHGQQEIAYGRRIGKSVWLGLEFSPNEMAKLTFHGQTIDHARRELRLVKQALANEPAFGGIVIHHYGTYLRWLREHRAEHAPIVFKP